MGIFDLGGLDIGDYANYTPEFGSAGSTFNLGDYGGDWWKGGDFNLSSPGGENWWSGGNWSLPDAAGTSGGGGNWWDSIAKSLPGSSGDWKNALGGIADVGKFGFGAWQAIDKSQQMAQYNKAVEDYYKKQSDYIAQKQAWEKQFMDQFAGAQEEFAGANEEFQGQLGEAQGQLAEASSKANDVMGQFLNAAKPVLGQSQELLVAGTAALARGETPDHWEPILNEARLRGTAAMVQSMVAAGMSPEEARASAQPMAEQQAHTMLLQLATQMLQQGGQLTAYGMQGLAGAGQMTDVMGKMAGIQGQLAQAGMGPASQEFAAMMNVIGHIIGGNNNFPQPPPPVG
jgi:hypothetical protein